MPLRKRLTLNRAGPSGFTIVELLIVIVVIAVLSAITVVAYSGIQQRAKNAAIVTAAGSSLRLIQSYLTVSGSYPMGVGDVCITTATTCQFGAGGTTPSSSSFDSALGSVGALSRAVPATSADYYGITMSYHSQATYNGASAPARLTFYLAGTNQKCGLAGVETESWPSYQSSTTGFTNGDVGGKTLCWINIPGPPAS